MKKMAALYGILGMVMIYPGNLLAQETSSSGTDRYAEMYEKYKSKVGSSSAVQDYVCGDSYSDKVNAVIEKLTPNVCAQLNTNPDLADNPYAYENPQATCDIGASLNGLPDWDGFGFNKNGADACGILDMVAGDKIREKVGTLNEYGQMVDKGLSATENIDIDGMMKQTLGD